MGTSNKKPGRPGRPKKIINDKETLDKITELGALGLTFGQIARCLGISRSSLDRKRAEFEEIEEAIKKGESLGIAKVASALVDSAVIDKNPTSMIFYLKNRSENWADRQEVNHNLDLGGILTDARQRIIDSTSERLDAQRTHELTNKQGLDISELISVEQSARTGAEQTKSED
jgi:hypothetical protein